MYAINNPTFGDYHIGDGFVTPEDVYFIMNLLREYRTTEDYNAYWFKNDEERLQVINKLIALYPSRYERVLKYITGLFS